MVRHVLCAILMLEILLRLTACSCNHVPVNELFVKSCNESRS